eukprot:364628-Chlamydomonas_euryale.AAC.7
MLFRHSSKARRRYNRQRRFHVSGLTLTPASPETPSNADTIAHITDSSRTRRLRVCVAGEPSGERRGAAASGVECHKGGRAAAADLGTGGHPGGEGVHAGGSAHGSGSAQVQRMAHHMDLARKSQLNAREGHCRALLGTGAAKAGLKR